MLPASDTFFNLLFLYQLFPYALVNAISISLFFTRLKSMILS
jgi:hypothetical protein